MIGFTVDYTVHIGHAYLENHHLDTRRKRMRMALTDMGVSIFFGALTTFVSVIPLVLLPLILFKKFGTLIMITVIFGLSWALVFFPSLLLIMGPQFDQGAIPIVHKALTWISDCCGPTCAGRGNDDEGKTTPRDKKTSDVELNPLTPNGQKATIAGLGHTRVN
jgi:multidrug efflux pump subunit AcrB